jgi:hypothetical protein
MSHAFYLARWVVLDFTELAWERPLTAN